MIGEAEKEIASHGFTQYRVRHHGPVARIELQVSDINRIMEPAIRERIVKKLKELGFLHVTLDLEGYVTGSMNRALEVPKVEQEPGQKGKTGDRKENLDARAQTSDSEVHEKHVLTNDQRT